MIKQTFWDFASDTRSSPGDSNSRSNYPGFLTSTKNFRNPERKLLITNYDVGVFQKIFKKQLTVSKGIPKNGWSVAATILNSWITITVWISTKIEKKLE